MPNTLDQRKFWATLEKVEEFQTIEFYHPDFGHIYLVVDKFFDVTLNLNGSPTVFKPVHAEVPKNCLLYTSPSPRDRTRSRMPSSA